MVMLKVVALNCFYRVGSTNLKLNELRLAHKGFTMLYSAIDGTLHTSAEEAQAYNAEWRKGL
jgi:hypothetical protein